MKNIPSAPEYMISPDGIVTKNGTPITINQNGSVRVAIRRKMVLVSKLLAETYLGMPTEQDCSIVYRDGNPLNVNLSNIMWVDPWYSQIKEPTCIFEGETFHHATHLATKQYYVSQSGKILNFATKQLINPVQDSIGYLRFSYYSLSSNNKRVKRTVAVHILVYCVFKGEYDNEKYEINHIDGNKQNNHISNLEVVSHQENVRHAVRKNLKRVKYTETHIAEVISLLQAGKSWTDIYTEYLQPTFKTMTKTQAFSLINGIANDKNAYAEKCDNLGFVKGSTTRASRSYTTS